MKLNSNNFLLSSESILFGFPLTPLKRLEPCFWPFCPRLKNLLDPDNDDGGDGEDGPENLESVGDVTEDDNLQHQRYHDAAGVLHQADNVGLLWNIL